MNLYYNAIMIWINNRVLIIDMHPQAIQLYCKSFFSDDFENSIRRKCTYTEKGGDIERERKGETGRRRDKERERRRENNSKCEDLPN